MGQDAENTFRENIKAFGVGDYVTLKVGMCEDESMISWLDEPLQWVFQDASHVRREVEINLNIYYPRLKPGGLIVIHDTNQADPPAVMREWQKSKGIVPVIVGRPDFEVWMKPL